MCSCRQEAKSNQKAVDLIKSVHVLGAKSRGRKTFTLSSVKSRWIRIRDEIIVVETLGGSGKEENQNLFQFKVKLRLIENYAMTQIWMRI